MEQTEIEVRPAEETDHAAMLAVLEARDLDQMDRVTSDLEDVRWRWREDDFSPREDTWVALHGGVLAGYALTHKGEIEVHVHPGHLGLGLGTRLRQFAEERALRAATDHEVVVKQNPSSLDPYARPLLERAGYRFSHDYTRMERPLNGDLPDALLPEGVSIRTYRLGPDDRPLYEAYNDAWREYSSQEWEAPSFDSWMNNTQGDDFDPRFWYLALEDDRILGFSLCFKYPESIWLQALGTRPEHRHRGLGRALLNTTLQKARANGYSSVALTVSSRNLADARRLYEATGFVEVLRYTNLRKTLKKA